MQSEPFGNGKVKETKNEHRKSLLRTSSDLAKKNSFRFVDCPDRDGDCLVFPDHSRSGPGTGLPGHWRPDLYLECAGMIRSRSCGDGLWEARG
jgi:hypothetical protein